MYLTVVLMSPPQMVQLKVCSVTNSTHPLTDHAPDSTSEQCVLKRDMRTNMNLYSIIALVYMRAYIHNNIRSLMCTYITYS